MKPKYKSKMRQKQQERARANRAESNESNKPKTTSAERMRNLRERCKAETSGVASEPRVTSTSRAAKAMDIDTDSEQSPHSQTESTQYSTRSLCNSHNSTFVNDFLAEPWLMCRRFATSSVVTRLTERLYELWPWMVVPTPSSCVTLVRPFFNLSVHS
jgi:hypothetical protein